MGEKKNHHDRAADDLLHPLTQAREPSKPKLQGLRKFQAVWLIYLSINTLLMPSNLMLGSHRILLTLTNKAPQLALPKEETNSDHDVYRVL